MEKSSALRINPSVSRASTGELRRLCGVDVPNHAELIEAKLIAEREADTLKKRVLELSAELIAAREAVRTHLARELHDSVGAELTAARLALANAEYLLPVDTNAPCTAALGVAKQSLDAASLASRRVIENLHAPALDAGIVCALSQWTESFAARTRLRTSVVCDADVRLTQLPHPALLAIFRVTQEALSNVAKHAGASSADVRIDTDRRHLTVIIKDDGRGIGHPRHTAGRNFGIVGMRARCEAFGGTLRIESTRPHGTTLHARFAWHSMLAGDPSCGAPRS